jgi:hypothetical protein
MGVVEGDSFIVFSTFFYSIPGSVSRVGVVEGVF